MLTVLLLIGLSPAVGGCFADESPVADGGTSVDSTGTSTGPMNLLRNPSFEDEDNLIGWRIGDASSSEVVSDAHDGVAAVRVEGRYAELHQDLNVPVSIGTTKLIFRAWVRAGGGVGSTPSLHISNFDTDASASESVTSWTTSGAWAEGVVKLDVDTNIAGLRVEVVAGDDVLTGFVVDHLSLVLE